MSDVAELADTARASVAPDVLSVGFDRFVVLAERAIPLLDVREPGRNPWNPKATAGHLALEMDQLISPVRPETTTPVSLARGALVRGVLEVRADRAARLARVRTRKN